MGAMVRTPSSQPSPQSPIRIRRQNNTHIYTGSSTQRYASPNPNKVCTYHTHGAAFLFTINFAERQQFDRTLAATLSKSLRTMLMHTSSEQGRAAVPPITNSDVSPFPLKIAVRVGGVELG